jgi:hypothetical protein
LIGGAQSRQAILGIQPKNSFQTGARALRGFGIEGVREIDPRNVLSSARRRSRRRMDERRPTGRRFSENFSDPSTRQTTVEKDVERRDQKRQSRSGESSVAPEMTSSSSEIRN